MGKNLKYGEFTFSAPKARPSVSGYAYGGKVEPTAMKKGGETKGQAKIAKVMGEFKRGELHSGSSKGPLVKNPKQAMAIAMSEKREAGYKKGGEAKKGEKSVKLVGMKMEPEAIVKKEVALLKKAGAPAKLIKHEEREGALMGLKKGGKACYADGGSVTEQDIARDNARQKSLKGTMPMTDREKRMMEQAKQEKMDRAQNRAYEKHYEDERAENMATRKAAKDALMYVPRKIGEGARSAYDAVMGKKKGGEVHSDVAMDKKIVKKAVHKHEAAMHPGKPLTKLKKGGVPTFNRTPKC